MARRPHFSSDGHTVLFAAEVGDGSGGVREAGIWSVGADTPTASSQYVPPCLLILTRSYLSDLDFSAKANLLVFVSDADRAYDYALYMVAPPAVPAKGSPLQNARRLARSPSTPSASLSCPTFAPVASMIYFLSGGNPDHPQAELWKVKPDGSPPTRITGISP